MVSEEKMQEALSEKEEELTVAKKILAAQSEELREQNNVINLVYGAVIVRDLDRLVIIWNKGAENMYGWKEEEILGKQTSDILKTTHGLHTDGVYEKVFRDGIWEGELERVKKDGEKIIVESKWVIERDKSGKAISIIEVNNDITKRKCLEEKLAQYTLELEGKIADRTKELELAIEQSLHSAAKDQVILENMADGILVVDDKGIIIRVNPRAETMIGKKAEEIVGKCYYEINLQNEKGEQIPEGLRPLYHILNGRVQDKSSSTYFLARSETNRIPVGITCSPISVNGKIVGAVNTLRDISKEKEIERVKSEFISIASHQLRTPLTTLSWYVDATLFSKEKLTPKQREHLKEIKNATERLIDLVGGLLNVSRIELGTFESEPKAIDIVKIVKGVKEDLKVVIAKKKLSILERYPKDTPVMQADFNLVRVVIQNLFSNAVKYTLRGGEVEVSVERKDQNILIKVRDTGCGIPSEVQNNVFKKFFRAENSRNLDPNGNGLGLYITKSIIEFCNGKIWFSSEENVGTTFYVFMPLTERRKRQLVTLKDRRKSDSGIF
ncbi:PAS domain-containing sensor histidine kinase [Candidatus Giovannonibacteria bacterium]|nr:PAS domain-containing sensor histidine kinase [Candidatus Giovannonibacteria bacterium]